MGNYAKVALIFAQTDPEKKHRGLAAFLVPTESSGFSSTSVHGKLGLRASDTAELQLDGVEVGDEALLGEVGDGFKVAMSALDSGRYSVAAGCVGICQGCVDASVAYSKEREQFGRPIAAFQLVQEMIADMTVDTHAARALVWRAGWLKDTGKPSTTETSWPSCSPPRRPSATPTSRSRCTAAPATSTTTRSSATSATRA